MTFFYKLSTVSCLSKICKKQLVTKYYIINTTYFFKTYKSIYMDHKTNLTNPKKAFIRKSPFLRKQIEVNYITTTETAYSCLLNESAVDSCKPFFIDYIFKKLLKKPNLENKKPVKINLLARCFLNRGLKNLTNKLRFTFEFMSRVNFCCQK